MRHFIADFSKFKDFVEHYTEEAAPIVESDLKSQILKDAERNKELRRLEIELGLDAFFFSHISPETYLEQKAKEELREGKRAIAEAKRQVKKVENLNKLSEQRKDMRERSFKLLGQVCAQCGCADKDILQIDHVLPVGKYRANEWQKYILIVTDFEGQARIRYQILCSNCNLKKKKTNKEWAWQRRDEELFNEQAAFQRWKSEKADKKAIEEAAKLT